MVDLEHKIPSNRIVIIALIIGVIGSIVLMLLGDTGSPPVTMHPICILIVSVWGLMTEYRTLYVSKEMFYIRYHLLPIKRKVPWERVRAVELICGPRLQYTLLVHLDNCPVFSKTKLKNLGIFILIHPFKLIATTVYPYKTMEYIKMLQSYFPNAVLINSCTKQVIKEI